MAVSFNFTGDYAIDQGADWYATFIYKQPAEITNITANGTTVTVTAANGFTTGQTVSIDGVIPPIYNLQNVTIASVTPTSFTITNGATGIYISGGLATSAVNLTNATAALQLRSLPSSSDAVLSLATGGNGITITALTGQVDTHATAAQTRDIDPGVYYYDLEITQDGVTTRLAQGQAEVSAEVTR